MKEQMRIELHNETEYTERISFQNIWTHANRLKYAGCRVAAITDRNSVNGIHMAEHYFQREGIQTIYGVTLNCIDVDDRYDVVLLAANLIGRDNIFRLIELLESNRFSFGRAVTREQLDAHRKGILLGVIKETNYFHYTNRLFTLSWNTITNKSIKTCILSSLRSSSLLFL